MDAAPLEPADQIKAALRAELRAHRRALAEAAPKAAQAAAAHFFEAEPGRFAAAALYHPVGAEMDPRPLGRLLRARGVRLGWPVVVARDQPLLFREQDEHAALVPDAIGILSPPTYAPAVQPELLVVPLLAFDAKGGRLGQGGGFYDRTLAALRQAGAPVLAVGLGYAGQELADIPLGRFDEPLDGVLTEEGYRRFGV